MANIQNELNNIKNAVFGKDVRDSIHNAIKTCYDDASIVNNNANMEVKMARGVHSTLGDRLNKSDEKQEEISSQLEHIEDNILSIKSFGAKCDGVSDDSEILVNKGVPIFPPKKHLYPFASNILYINVVVVVFPSLPVTPITVLGESSNTFSISEVNIAPFSTSFTISGMSGLQLGERNI